MGYDKSSYEQQTYSSYSREDLKDKIERLKANYERLQVAYRHEKNENDTLRARIEELEAAIPCWADQLRRVVEQCNNVSTERDALRVRVEGLQARTQELEGDYEYKNKKLCEAYKERDLLKARVSELEAELKYDHEEYKRLRDALRAELEQQTALAIRWMDSYNELALPGEQIKGEKMGEDRTWNLEPVTALRAENARLKNNIEGLNYIIGKLEAELDELRDEAHVERKVVAKLQAELADWKLAYDVMLKDANERLAATKPVPVVVERYLFVTGSSGYADLDGQRANVKVTYTDGVLTGAEVVG